MNDAAIRTDSTNGMPYSSTSSSFMPPTVQCTDRPRVRAGGEQRGDAGERHLAQRQLTGPTGEDGQGQRADGEREDRGVEKVPRRLRDDQGQRDGHRERDEQDEPVEVPHPEDLPESLGHGVDPRGEGERLAFGALPALESDDEQHHEEQHDVGDTGLVERVEPQDGLDQPDAEPGAERGRKRPEPTDQCSHEGRSSVAGPSAARLPPAALRLPRSTIDTVATNPVTAHTQVDTIFGFTPASRARSRLAAGGPHHAGRPRCGSAPMPGRRRAAEPPRAP